MDLTDTKLIASATLFALTLLCGYLPVRVLLNQRLVRFAMFAGGGVLMATAFGHLLPESHDQFKHYLNNEQISNIKRNLNSIKSAELTKTKITNLMISNTNNNIDDESDNDNNSSFDNATHSHKHTAYPEIVTCCGFFFMYLVEYLMIRFIGGHSHSNHSEPSTPTLPAPTVQQQQQQHHHHQQHHFTTTTTTTIPPTSSSSSLSINKKTANSSYKFLRGLLIVSAFGAHSLFDGIAIGSQSTNLDVWKIFFAISCHKLIIAAVVGLELFSATLKSHIWTLIHLSIFSIMSPLGIILVVVAESSFQTESNAHEESSNPVMILLQSFATGTLLYIVFIEILQPKKPSDLNREHDFGKIVSMLLGFTLMMLVLTFMPAE